MESEIEKELGMHEDESNYWNFPERDRISQMANAIRCAREEVEAKAAIAIAKAKAETAETEARTQKAVFSLLDMDIKEIDILDILSFTSEQFKAIKAKWEIEKASSEAAPTSQEDENAGQTKEDNEFHARISLS